MENTKKKILIVEDDLLTSKVISKQLEVNNYKTFIVHNGEDSIEAIKNNSSISLVIMDIDLGAGIDGTVAAKEILKIKKIPIIFHTSHSEKEIVEKAKEITRYGYILKNPGEFVLLSAIEMAFQLFESHKKSEENELRWRFALEGSRDGVWDWMVQTGQVFFSKQWKSIIGYEEFELENNLEEWDKRVHPDDKSLCYERIHRHFEHKTEYYESEHRLLSKDGTYKWILDRGKVFDWSQDGKPLRMIGTHTDITERKSLEERILISEGNFRTFFDAINEYIFILDEQGNILKVNDFVLNNLGYQEENLINKNITLFHKNCIEYKDQDPQKNLFNCIEKKLPIFIIPKNNQEISVESKVIKGLWNEKNALFLVEKDISDLKASEEKFSKMFHISSTLMILTDLEKDQIVDVNDTFLNTLGYEKDFILRTPASKMNLWFDLEDRAKALAILNRDGKLSNLEGKVKDVKGNIKYLLFSTDFIYIKNKKILFTEMQDITERKIAENRIKESENLYRLLAENTNDVIWTMDFNFNFTYVSPSIFQLRGYTPDEVKKQKIEEVVCSSSMPFVKIAFSNLLSGIDSNNITSNDSVLYELEQPCKDGSTIWTESTGKVVYENGNAIGIVGVTRNISERKKAEDSIRNSEKHLKDAQRIANIASWTWRLDSDIIYWSEEAYRIFEVDKNEFESSYTEYLNYIHKHDRSFVESIINESIKNKTNYQVEYRIVLKNGKEKYISELGEVILEKDTLFALNGTIQDITERKEIILKLQDSERMLKEAQRIANIGNWVWDVSSNDIFWTEEVYRIFGITDPYFKPNYENTIKMSHPEDIENVKEVVFKAIEDKKPYVVIHRLITPDGNIKTVQENGEPSFDKNENLLSIIGTVKDITDLKNQENEIKKLLSEKETLLKEVHHRIKNNLATIASLLSIQSTQVKDKAVVQVLKETRGRIRTMVDIYDKIYRSTDFKNINIKDYLDDIISKISSSYIVSDNVVLETDIQDLIVDVKVSFPLGIIVTELITNSLKYAFDGKAKGVITVNLSQNSDNSLKLIVSDNGKGIDPEILKSKKYGFGLNLVDILLNQKGSIDITNNNGTRSEVLISI